MSPKTLLPILLFSIFCSTSIQAVIFNPSTGSSSGQHQVVKIKDFLEARNMEQLFGKDLNWKQKWALRIMKRKLRKAAGKNPNLLNRQLTGLAIDNGVGFNDDRPEPNYKTSGLSLGSFILGILSLPSLGLGIPAFFVALLAVVIGIFGLREAKRKQMKGRGFAWMGILLGALILGAFIGFILTFGA